MLEKMFGRRLIVFVFCLVPPSLALLRLPVLVDTDIGPWADDVGALAILQTYHERLVLNVRAIVANDRYEGIIVAIEALERYLNNGSLDVQIGITKDHQAGEHDGEWPKWIAKNFPHPIYQRNDDAEDAVTVYRRMLATGPNNKTVILSLGYFFNLANLLDSGPDQYSPLNGIELIRKKVMHLVVMAGRFPNGTESNVAEYPLIANQTLERWPTSIIFIGAESGEKIRCGQEFLKNNKTNEIKNPVEKAWKLPNTDSLQCFDEIAAFMVGYHGNAQLYEPIYGRIEIFENGTNIWHASPNNSFAKMAYLRQIASEEEILSYMDPLLVRK